jgi:hypothetical protein
MKGKGPSGLKSIVEAQNDETTIPAFTPAEWSETSRSLNTCVP